MIKITPQIRFETSFNKQEQNINRQYFTRKSDSVSFSANSSLRLEKALKYAKRFQKRLAQDYKDNALSITDAEKLEGIQDGIPVFGKMNLKEILFSLNNLYGIAATRGCYNHCAHCYASAPPMGREIQNTINRMSFEDFNKFFSGVGTLGKRLGFSPMNEKEAPLFFDSDSINTYIYDKFGKEHDFIELSNIVYEQTGKLAQFDTAGWNINDKKSQQLAEKYVNYYSKPENEQKLYLFALSFNPYHSILAKAQSQLEKGDLKNYLQLREIYIKRMANAMYTFTPLVKSENFRFIPLYDKNDIPGFKKIDLTDLKNNVINELRRRYQENDNLGYINNPEDINKICKMFSDKMMTSDRTVKHPLKLGRYSEFLKTHKIEPYKLKDKPFDFEFDTKKILNSNGDIYLYPEYRKLYKTGLQFNFDNKNKETINFGVPVEEITIPQYQIDYTYSI